MSVFGYMETFFFISLGITFVLILLLVFHFKQRISDLEDKSETMFQIINDIVKELSSVKQVCCANQFGETTRPINFCCLPSTNNPGRQEKIIVSDDGEESDDDDDDDESLSDDSDDDDEGPPPLLNILEDSPVKIISVDISESNNTADNIAFEETIDEEIIEPAPIRVEKLETEPEADVSVSGPAVDTSKEIYRKMTLQALKTLVITKGLSSDPSKLKKNELLKLLEANEE